MGNDKDQDFDFDEFEPHEIVPSGFPKIPDGFSDDSDNTDDPDKSEEEPIPAEQVFKEIEEEIQHEEDEADAAFRQTVMDHLSDATAGIVVMAKVNEESPFPEIRFIFSPIKNFHMHLVAMAACYLSLREAIEKLSEISGFPVEAIDLMIEADSIILQSRQTRGPDINQYDEDGDQII